MPIKGQSPKEVMHTEMHKFKEGELHSGSKHGPKVKNRKQAIAIGLSEAKQAKGYDRTSHHSGNPGFPSSESSSPPGLNESQTTTEQYHPQAHTFKPPHAAHAHGFSAGHHNDGHLRNSGHSHAHRIGKRSK